LASTPPGANANGGGALERSISMQSGSTQLSDATATSSRRATLGSSMPRSDWGSVAGEAPPAVEERVAEAAQVGRAVFSCREWAQGAGLCAAGWDLGCERGERRWRHSKSCAGCRRFVLTGRDRIGGAILRFTERSYGLTRVWGGALAGEGMQS
jgi:hypothetical protein